VRARHKKHAEKGYDKTSADRWLKHSIEGTKRATNDESFRYKEAKLNYKKLAEDGLVRKLSDKETANKIETGGKLTKQAYDIANKMGYKDIGSDKLDITKPNKNG